MLPIQSRGTRTTLHTPWSSSRNAVSRNVMVLEPMRMRRDQLSVPLIAPEGVQERLENGSYLPNYILRQDGTARLEKYGGVSRLAGGGFCRSDGRELAVWRCTGQQHL